MSKITLNNVGSLIDATTAQTTINNNSAVIQIAMDNTLSRDGTSPNQMAAPLDMNGQQIINLPAPSSVNSPARLVDVVTNPTVVIPTTGTSGHTVPFLDGTNTWSGAQSYAGSTSGSTLVKASAIASGTITIPAVTDTLVTKTTTDTLTNKTLTAPVMTTPVLGTPTSGTLTNCTGLPVASVTGLGTNVATFLATPSSANLASAMTSSTGSGSLVFGSSPVLTSPTLTTPILSSVTLSKGQYPGTATNDSATAGNFGEDITSTIASGSAVSLTTSTPVTITSISLTAGDWDISGILYFTGGATTVVQYISVSISTVTNTFQTNVGLYNIQPAYSSSIYTTPAGNASGIGVIVPPARISLTSTTTYYIVAQSTFSTSTSTAYGKIRARRIR